MLPPLPLPACIRRLRRSQPLAPVWPRATLLLHNVPPRLLAVMCAEVGYNTRQGRGLQEEARLLERMSEAVTSIFGAPAAAARCLTAACSAAAARRGGTAWSAQPYSDADCESTI